jgi:hypothetical protein
MTVETKEMNEGLSTFSVLYDALKGFDKVEQDFVIEDVLRTLSSDGLR